MRRRSLAGSPEEHAAAELEAANDATKAFARAFKDIEKGKCVSAAHELVVGAEAVGAARESRRWLPRKTGKGAYENPLARAASELTAVRGAFNLKCLVGPGLDGLKRRRRRSRK
jgi:hypothetical protein